MSKKPFFSIVIPTYNRAADLQFALYCIFRQTFTDFEVVISDNCSTDNTRLVVQKIKDKRIRYFRLSKTVGNAVNFKNGIKHAKGKYVFLHSDDDFLLYSRSLEEIYNKIIKQFPGYVRINYVSLSIDKKRIFYYKLLKRKNDDYLAPSSDNKEILTFILNSDPYFISGIIFKNELSYGVGVIDSDPVPCIEIIFDVIRKFGGYYFAKPYIVASWSRRERKKNKPHHVYVLIDGKLRFEPYFEEVKRNVSKETYAKFLHRELMNHFVSLFPVIKFHIGNKKTLQISSRIFQLDPTMKINITFWTCLIISFLLPGSILKVLRDTFLSLLARYSKVEGGDKIYATIKNLQLEYTSSDHYLILQSN